MKPVEVGEYLVVDPRVCHGQLTFKGTRLPVETILHWLGKGKTLDSILTDWPYLTREAVAEAMGLASEALTERYAKGRRPNHEPGQNTPEGAPMNTSGTPTDEFDPALYEENRRKFTLEQLAPFEGKHVAWSLDGTRILASGEDLLEVDKNLVAAGIDPSKVVFGYIDPPGLVLL